MVGSLLLHRSKWFLYTGLAELLDFGRFWWIPLSFLIRHLTYKQVSLEFSLSNPDAFYVVVLPSTLARCSACTVVERARMWSLAVFLTLRHIRQLSLYRIMKTKLIWFPVLKSLHNFSDGDHRSSWWKLCHSANSSPCEPGIKTRN